MDAVKFIALHLELECIGFDSAGDLIALPCENPDTLPLFYAARYTAGEVRYFRQGLAASLRSALNSLPLEVVLHDEQTVCDLLMSSDTHTGRSYIFPDTLSADDYPDAVQLNTTHAALVARFNPELQVENRTVYAVIAAGQIVSTCESSRENNQAGEAWVQTLPDYRGRGFARQVTAAWAHALQQQGKTPFYSHKHTNLASQGVARSLSLMQYIEDAVYA